VTWARSLLIAMLAVALLRGARPIAGDEQFPRGLMSAALRAGNTSCTIETRPLSFGNYDPLADAAVDAVGLILYLCEGVGGGGGPPDGRGGPGTRAAQLPGIRIEMAQGSSNSFQHRGMVGPEYLVGGGFLDYNIYLDATHTTVWGTGEGSTQYYYDANPPANTPVNVPAYGRIFRGQDVMAGPYTDNVPVRILF
jgi:spore coat protein U domain-containing protein, fimbrial subunit CupE1/2/3/6